MIYLRLFRAGGDVEMVKMPQTEVNQYIKKDLIRCAKFIFIEFRRSNDK